LGKFLEACRDELIVFVRHSAWLNTAPDHPDKDKGKKHKSRRATLEKKYGKPLAMPECGAQYIAAYLFDIGPTLHGEMGEYPLTHGELHAWMSNTGIELNVWESQTLRRMSVEYLSAQQAATSTTALPPWRDAPYARVDPAEQAKRLQRHLEGLAK
jgi:hypothetical protein